MEGFLLGVAVLACPVGMGLMMWFMSRGKRKDDRVPAPDTLEHLRMEHERLGAQIERMEEGDVRNRRLKEAPR